MNETLWISLPEQEAEAIAGVIQSIAEKNLSPLSVNQFIEKLTANNASDWEEVFSTYNNIPSVRNLAVTEMLVRTQSIKDKFRQRHYLELENKEFTPNQLLGLIILCYSNPSLIGQKLCAALQENNTDAIAREMLENSAFVKDKNRVVSWASNLRLLNYALYANDTEVELPSGVLRRIREGAAERGITLMEINRFANANASTSVVINETIAGAIQFERLHEGLSRPNQLTSEASSGVSPVNVSDINDVLIGSLGAIHFLKNVPVISVVMRNIAKDLGNGFSSVTNYTGRFFTGNNNRTSPAEVEQKSAFLPHYVTKP